MTYPFLFFDISICHEKLAVFLLENKNKNCVLIHKLWTFLTLVGVFGQVGLANLIEILMMSSKLATQGFLEIIMF